jgi:hypothetical protein
MEGDRERKQELTCLMEKKTRDVGDGQVDKLHTRGQLPRVVSSL